MEDVVSSRLRSNTETADKRRCRGGESDADKLHQDC